MRCFNGIIPERCADATVPAHQIATKFAAFCPYRVFSLNARCFFQEFPMDRIRIVGGNKLNGTIAISGAKNAALPLMIAALLTDETLILDNVPRLADVAQLQRILGNHGVDIMSAGKRPGDREYQGQTLHISAAHVIDTTAPYELVSRMRASFWVIAPLLARMRQAKVSLPGGCAIGTRPVDLLLMALGKLGAEITIDGGYVLASAPDGLRGATIDFPKVTVSGTHVAMMAATLARGTSIITNAACEPEIGDVAACLNKMGASISGAGTPRIVIEGVERLHGARHTVLPDRIEAGTYAMAVAMTGGDVQLTGARPELLQAALDVLRQAGAEISVNSEGIRVARNGAGIRPVTVATAPFPGFPTDLQAQLMALMVQAEGASEITETIFENRFMHVQELARFGARISLSGETARIEGVTQLRGAPVMATDLRASVSLVIAGLAAEGETMVNRVYHLDRGFERLEEKLKACGASIERISD
jgi:UDP-N-acetylglucosamine 1-carboxyvinyltransferase